MNRKAHMSCLRELTTTFRFSVSRGDLQVIDGRWYVTHTGLLSLAKRQRCAGICTSLVKDLCESSSDRWVFRATVYTSPRSRGFVGYGDADPSNVLPHLHGCELRIAETRAVSRALRKAYGIGLCSLEELGWIPRPLESDPENGNGRSNENHSRPRLRDRLSLLIRQHRLDPSLVKLYAAEFCGTQILPEASRDLVEDFIRHLAEWAARDHDGLVCHLNRYANSAESQEVQK